MFFFSFFSVIIIIIIIMIICFPFGADMDGPNFGHKVKSHPAPESRVGEEGTSKRNITRKGGAKVCPHAHMTPRLVSERARRFLCA